MCLEKTSLTHATGSGCQRRLEIEPESTVKTEPSEHD